MLAYAFKTVPWWLFIKTRTSTASNVSNSCIRHSHSLSHPPYILLNVCHFISRCSSLQLTWKWGQVCFNIKLIIMEWFSQGFLQISCTTKCASIVYQKKSLCGRIFLCHKTCLATKLLFFLSSNRKRKDTAFMDHVFSCLQPFKRQYLHKKACFFSLLTKQRNHCTYGNIYFYLHFSKLRINAGPHRLNRLRTHQTTLVKHSAILSYLGHIESCGLSSLYTWSGGKMWSMKILVQTRI